MRGVENGRVNEDGIGGRRGNCAVSKGKKKTTRESAPDERTLSVFKRSFREEGEGKSLE